MQSPDRRGRVRFCSMLLSDIHHWSGVGMLRTREVEDQKDDRDEAVHHHRPVHIGRSRVRRRREEHHHCKSHVSNETYVPSVLRLTKNHHQEHESDCVANKSEPGSYH
jgi:hypothetical protein